MAGHRVEGAVIAMGSGTGSGNAGGEDCAAPVDPALLARPDVRAALAGHDIGTLFRVLGENGWPQRVIAKVTGMPQSSVSEIVTGRRVIDYRVLVRIADGLGIPREWMSLGDGSAYAGEVDLPEEVRAEMRRRALLAVAGMTIAGRPIQGIGELVEAPGPEPVPLPAQISELHVAKVRDLTQRLREAGRAYGADPQVSSASAAWATRLLDVPGAEPVKRALQTAVAESHIHAGWDAFDGGLSDRAMYHYTRGLELATEAGDAYLQAVALMYSGMATVEHGHPNDGLKMLQFGLVKAADIPLGEPRRIGGANARAAVEACTHNQSAIALARLGYPADADAEQAKARQRWQPTALDPTGDLDIETASLELDRGRLDVAEPFAVASVRRWEVHSQRARTLSSVILATIHVRAGEPDGLRLAHTAITGVSKLSSVRARQRLEPLTAALQARPSTDHRQLARMSHHVATTRL